MYIAFSALSPQPDNNGKPDNKCLANSEALLRFKAYVAACEKYRHEIAAIQKYMPGWKPLFNR